MAKLKAMYPTAPAFVSSSGTLPWSTSSPSFSFTEEDHKGLAKTQGNLKYRGRDDIIFAVDKGLFIKATGSRVTTHYAEYSDYDYVVYDPKDVFLKHLIDTHAVQGGSGRSEGPFNSWRRDEYNFILVKTKDLFEKWDMATELLRVSDPETKEERIKLFDIVFNRKEEAPVF